MSYNNVVLMGNLTRDPEIKVLPSGSTVTRIGMALNHKYRDKNDQLQNQTTFVDVNAFGKTGEIVSRYLKKGEPVLIGGRLRYSSWDAKDGSGKRSKLDVVAENVRLLPRRGNSGPGGFGGFAPESNDPAFPGEFPADAAAAYEDAEDEDPFAGPPFGGGMPNGRK